MKSAAEAIEVTVVDRRDQQRKTIRAAQIINCSGPGNTCSSRSEPLVAQLLRNGEVAPDPSGLGLQALPNGRLLDAAGSPQGNLYTIGWPMRGVLLETTAVRELRTQARILADTLLMSLSADTAQYSLSTL